MDILFFLVFWAFFGLFPLFIGFFGLFYLLFILDILFYPLYLEEIYEMLDFIEDKSTLCLFPVEEMDKEEGGGVNLEVYNYNNDYTAVGVEAHLWDNQEYFAIIKGCYNLGEQFPKFVFHYFES